MPASNVLTPESPARPGRSRLANLVRQKIRALRTGRRVEETAHSAERPTKPPPPQRQMRGFYEDFLPATRTKLPSAKKTARRRDGRKRNMMKGFYDDMLTPEPAPARGRKDGHRHRQSRRTKRAPMRGFYTDILPLPRSRRNAPARRQRTASKQPSKTTPMKGFYDDIVRRPAWTRRRISRKT